MLDTVLHDVRYAIRGLRRAPGFATAAVLTLALGTGVNVAIFSVIDHTLLRPLPVPAPEQLVNIDIAGPRPGSRSGNGSLGPTTQIISYPLFRDLERIQAGLSGIAAQRDFEANVGFAGEATHEDGWLVSGSYFSVLGVNPALGRLFTPDDDRAIGGHPIVVLSYAYWRDRFGADPAVVNQRLVVNGQSLTVVGVAPLGFVGTTLNDTPAIFVPLTMAAQMRPDWNGFEDRRDHWLYAFARLRPGISRDDAERMIAGPFSALTRDVELPAMRSGLGDLGRVELAQRRLRLEPGSLGQRPQRDELRRLAVLLLCVAGCVLLLACANVANLLLARGSRRAQELSVRMSVGASRGQLVRQLLIETGLLAATAVVAGTVLAMWTVNGIAPLLPGGATFRFQFNVVLFLVTLGVSAATVVLAGLYPVLHLTRRTLASTAKTYAMSSGPAAARFRAALATVQIALSLTLLVLAGLFAESLRNANRLELGIQPDQLLTFRVSPKLSGYARERARLLAGRLEEELAAQPAVTAVAISTIPLIDGFGWSNNVTVEGIGELRDSAATADVGPGYFRTLGIPLLAGRPFADADDERAPRVAIVNESFAELSGLGRGIVGRRIGLGSGNVPLDITIVGLVGDARYSNLKESAPPQFYLPFLQEQRFEGLNFYVRSTGATDAAASTIRRVVAGLDPAIPVERLRTFGEQLRVALESDRAMAALAAAFAAVATLLAALGLFSVLSYTVAQRRREIGVRIALGATAARITRLIFGEAARTALAGSVLGIAAALALGRLAQTMLLGVSGADSRVLAGAVALITLVVAAAAAIPARRAARVDPVTALRAE